MSVDPTLNILNTLNTLFREIFKNPALQLSEATTAADVDGWDSLTHMEVISSVESHFGIKLKLTEVMRLKNIGDLCRIVQKHTS